MAFVVRPDRAIVRVDLGPSTSIDDAVDRWRAAFVESRPAEGRGLVELADGLSHLVWRPLERCLDGIRAVLVSPDESLARFPLAALPGRRPGSYLIEEMPIALIPVPQLLPQLMPRDRKARDAGGSPASLLLMGDIDFGDQPYQRPRAQIGVDSSVATRGDWMNFQQLPGTMQEIGDIRATFRHTNPGGVVFEARGAAATEAALRGEAPGKTFLHLATHGFFAPPQLRSALARHAVLTSALSGPALFPGHADPFGSNETLSGFHPGLLSGLALAGANRVSDPVGGLMQLDDGILTALEVAELDLGSTELVVLSACESGLGRAAGGEGLLGLQRAFQVAGARTVVASLWKVEDEATQQLMSQFYVNLWDKHLSPLESLRQAQLSILNGIAGKGQSRGVGAPEPGHVEQRHSRAHPRFWAAWVLSGDPGM